MMALTCAVKGSSNSSGKLKKWKTECMTAYILQKAVTMSHHLSKLFLYITIYFGKHFCNFHRTVDLPGGFNLSVS